MLFLVFQVRILLNKADEITAEELLKIQGNLVWNVSPLMSSLEPPTLYAKLELDTKSVIAC